MFFIFGGTWHEELKKFNEFRLPPCRRFNVGVVRVAVFMSNRSGQVQNSISVAVG